MSSEYAKGYSSGYQAGMKFEWKRASEAEMGTVRLNPKELGDYRAAGMRELAEEVKAKGSDKYGGGLYETISQAWSESRDTDSVWTEASNWLDEEIDAALNRLLEPPTS